MGAGDAEVPDGAPAYHVILAVDGLVPGDDELLGLLGIAGGPVADGRDQRPGAGAAWREVDGVTGRPRRTGPSGLHRDDLGPSRRS